MTALLIITLAAPAVGALAVALAGRARSATDGVGSASAGGGGVGSAADGGGLASARDGGGVGLASAGGGGVGSGADGVGSASARDGGGVGLASAGGVGSGADGVGSASARDDGGVGLASAGGGGVGSGADGVGSASARGDRLGRLLGTAFAAVAFVASVLLVTGDRAGGWFSYGTTPPAIVPWAELDVPWVPGLDLRFHLGVDGISYPLVVLTTLLTLLCCLYTIWHVPGGGRGSTLVALLLVVEVGIVGTFLALDLVLFFVFFEVVLLPMYAIIAGWGGEDRRHAARKFALYTLFGSVLLLVGVFTVVAAAGTADLVALGSGAAGLSRGTQIAAFTLFAIAFAVKSPLWPLHTWLPDAHTQAPTVGSVILAGVLLKMGTYGLIRVAVGVAPEGARWASPVLGLLAVAAILVGCLVCLAQTELKRLIAYSSVGHMGFVLLGVATLTATGIQAALIGNIAHGVITGLLFFLAGAVKDRFHTGDLTALGGLRERLPGLSGLLAFAAIASLGLPGLAGFWGEAFAVVAAFERGDGLWIFYGVLAAVGGALTAAYFLRLLRKVTHGPASAVVAEAPAVRVTGVEWAAWAPLVVLSVVIGLLPALVLAFSDGPVASLVEAVAR